MNKANETTPAKRVCRKCLRPLGSLDGPALDWRCLVCRLETEPPRDELAVIGIADGIISAVHYVDSRRVADGLAYAWRRVKLEVKVIGLPAVTLT